jgi:hypothetical protein
MAAPPFVPLVGGARLPLAFIVLGLAALAGAVAWMAAQPELLLLPYVHVQLIALVHLWLPGFLASVTLGSMYQMMPVVLGEPLRLPLAAAWGHFGVHLVGVAGLVAGLATGRFEVAAAGGAAVAAGTLVIALAVLRTFARSARRDAVAWSFPMATGWLLLTVLLGLAMALNRRWPFLPVSTVGLLHAHAHAGLAGFFLSLLQGVTFQLVPMFTLGELRRPRWVATGLWATQAGLPLLTVGLALAWPVLTAAGGVVVLAGLAATGGALGATLGTRRRRTFDTGVMAFLAGGGVMAAGALVGAAVLTWSSAPMDLRWVSLYGALVIAGGLSLMVLGMLCKIVPFLVWMKAYGPKVGRQPVPLATSLSRRGLERAWLAAHAGGLVMLGGGIALASPGVATAATWVLAAGVGAYLTNVARILGHLRHAS